MPTGQPIPADIKEAVVAFVRAGATRWMTARKFGLSCGTVASICHRAGLRVDDTPRTKLKQALGNSRTGYRRPKPTLPVMP